MHNKTALNKDDYMTCPSCERILTSFKPYRGPQADEEGMEDDSPEHDEDGRGGSGSGSGKGKRKDRYGSGSGSNGADALGFEPKVVGSSWVDRSDQDDFPLVPSAKTAALKAILLKGSQDAPLDKVSLFLYLASDMFSPFGV